MDANDQARQCGLAASGLSHEPYRFASKYVKAHVVDRMNDARTVHESSPGKRKVLDDIAKGQQRLFGRPGLGFGLRSRS